MSLRLCEETINVFSLLSDLINSSILRRASGSRPWVGSSQISKSGSLIRLAATASLAVMPFEKPEIGLPEAPNKSTARINDASLGLRTSSGRPNNLAM